MERSTDLDARHGRVSPAGWWVCLGTGGSVLLTIAGARLGGGAVSWWFHPKLLDGVATKVVFYAGVGALAVAWLGLGRAIGAHPVGPRWLWAVAAAWCLPLALGAPLFSRDVYSYLAQGTIAHLGLSPYREAPAVLAQLGHGHVLAAVDPFWRGTKAPYGPLFIGLVSVIVSFTGAHLIAGVLVVRALDLVGLVLAAVFVPRLARAAGADPARATWLVLLSPLVLLQLVAPAHNDLLMIGVMVAGLALALEGRPLWAIALCALAATIKVPALAAAIFVAVAWARPDPSLRGRLIKGAEAAVAVAAVGAAVTLITGFGPGWISSSLFSTPARVRLAVTPATDISWTLASLLRDVGASVTFRGLEPIVRGVAFAVVVVVVLALLRKTETRTLARMLGLALVAFALGGPAVWPWYLCWGLAVFAGWPAAQESRAVLAGVVIGSFLVKPNGILALPLGSSPVIAALWLLLAASAWYGWVHRGQRPRTGDLGEGLGPRRSVLAEP